MSQQRILVTGATGFIGCHIIEQLFEQGYKVRAMARGAKAQQLKITYADYGDRFDTVAVSDIAVDKFPEAFVGVHAVIHAAATVPARSSANVEDMITIAIEGTLNLLRQGQAAGVERYIVLSSIYTVIHPTTALSHKDWNPTTSARSIKPDTPSMAVYSDAKTLAERAMWDWSDQHPEVKITTMHPPWVFGPMSRFWVKPDAPNYYALTSNIVIATMLRPDGPYPPDPPYVDVRDTAKAAVLGIKAWKPALPGDRNRVVFFAPQFFNCGKARAELLRRHPEQEERVVTKEPLPFKGPAPIEYEWVERLLDFKKEDFHSFEDTFNDTLDYILALEEEWKAKGHKLEIPDPSDNLE